MCARQRESREEPKIFGYCIQTPRDLVTLFLKWLCREKRFWLNVRENDRGRPPERLATVASVKKNDA